MSRIGKNPIPLPAGVTVKVDGNTSVVKGPKGEHKQHIPEGLAFEEKDGVLTITRPDDSKTNRAKHGLVRALIANQVKGVTEGFVKKLEIEGVGYRAAVKGKVLDLQLQFSHPVEYPIPEGITIDLPRRQPHRRGRYRQAASGTGGGRDPRLSQARTLQGQGNPLCGRAHRP
jgi:large subunit ribosomal protein L6